MLIRRTFGALIVLLCAALPASAQYRFDSWTASDGLPQNIVMAIHQTRDGYLWLATLDGLVRFDGMRFRVFDKSTAPGIRSNRFNSLYEDSHGGLWVGTENSGVTRYAGGRFTTYTTEDGLPQNWIRGITGDETGRVWVLAGGRIMRWEGDRFRAVELGEFGEFAETNAEFVGSTWDSSVFWAVDGTRLYRFAGGQLTTLNLPHVLPRGSNDRVAEDPSGKIWIGTKGGGPVAVDAVTGLLARTTRPQTVIAWRNGNERLSEILLDDTLVRSVNLPPANRLESIPVNKSFEDREGNLWLATNGHGLYRVRRQAVSSYTAEQGLLGTNVNAIFQDSSGAVWAGLWNSGVCRIAGGKVESFTLRDGIRTGLVTAILEDRAGRLWVSGYHHNNGGLCLLRGGRFVEPDDHIIPDNTRAVVIYEDGDEALWFGTERGLVRYEGGATKIYTAADGLAGDDVRVIVPSVAGGMWIGAYGGLSRFKDGRFDGWTERDGLPSDHVRALYEDSDGVLWIGTYDGGLGRFQDGKFTRYTTADGLFSNGVFQILEDTHGDFWMGCNRGIYRVSKRELNEFAAGHLSAITSVAYGESDGMPNAECNGGFWPAGIKARDGKLWFPTQGGLAVIDPEALPSNPNPPPVVIETLLLDGSPASFDRPVRVAPGEASVEIQYTALSFVNSEHLRFKYKLDGLDRDWVDAGTRRVAYYPHLPPGEYTFTVLAANRDGIWSPEGSTLSIVVPPPFYRTWWFAALTVLALAGIVAFAWRRRAARWRERQSAQQEFTRQLIASQEGERKRIAAELHDSLGQNLLIIKNWAVLGLNRIAAEDPARDQLAEISTTATLSIEEVRTIAHNLRPYQLDRIGLTRTLDELVSRAAASSGIKFETDLAPLDGTLSKEAEIGLYRIVQEGINNIINHSGAGEARVSVELEGRAVRLTIADNGRGFSPEANAAAGGRREATRRGFGLTGLDERARLLGGRLRIDSAPGKGTTITMTLDTHENGHVH
jgi:signal transduction histidine kinase/ligand-binding sensor domain-containing protein